MGILANSLCLSKLCLCLHLKPKLLKQKLVRRYGLVIGAILFLTGACSLRRRRPLAPC